MLKRVGGWGVHPNGGTALVPAGLPRRLLKMMLQRVPLDRNDRRCAVNYHYVIMLTVA